MSDLEDIIGRAFRGLRRHSMQRQRRGSPVEISVGEVEFVPELEVSKDPERSPPGEPDDNRRIEKRRSIRG